MDDEIIHQKNNKMGYALKVHTPSLQFSVNRLWRFAESTKSYETPKMTLQFSDGPKCGL